MTDFISNTFFSKFYTQTHTYTLIHTHKDTHARNYKIRAETRIHIDAHAYV